MKKLTKMLLLATLLPLAGCATPYPGYSSGAWANYDGGYDSGYRGYDRPIVYGDYYTPNYYDGYAGTYYYGPDYDGY